MTTTIDESVKRSPELATSIEQADKILASVLGRSRDYIKTYLGDAVTAYWNEGRDDQNRRIAKLTLSDPSSSVSANFSSKELKNTNHLERQFNRLWDDLLKEISRKLSAKLRKTIDELEES